MNIEDYKAIEEQYHFRYPALFHTLLADGMLDWKTHRPDWYQVEFPKLRKNPPLLLFANDFEIITSKEYILEIIESFTDPDYYRKTKKEFHDKFIPFAQTGAGDAYCFFLDEENKVQSIVLVWHDADRVHVQAKTMEAFIFRQLLEYVVNPYVNENSKLEEFEENIHNQLNSHKKYIREEWVNILINIYNRGTGYQLLSEEECEEILLKVGIEDDEFEYQE